MRSKPLEKQGARYARQARALIPGIAGAALCLFAGRSAVTAADLPLPGAVAGLMLYAAAMLAFPPLRRRTEPGAALLVAMLGALIVPPFVGLTLFAPMLSAHWLPVAVILVVSTLLCGLVTAFVARALRRP